MAYKESSIFSLIIIVIVCVLIIVRNAKAEIVVTTEYGKEVDHFPDRESTFGAELGGAIRGLIWLADPLDACSPIKQPYYPTNNTFARFVLINSSVQETCSEYTKIQNAQNANYQLAVLFGDFNMNTKDVLKVLSRFGDLSIPAVLVGYGDGIQIKNLYVYANKSTEIYILQISENNPDIHKYILVFSIVIGFCFIVILLFMICLLVKYIQERRRSRRNRLSSRQIKQLPTETYTKGSQSDLCAICLEEYIEGEKLRILPCSHAYHAKCVDPWLRENRRNCPLCKRKVHLGDSSSSSESDSELGSPTENTPLLSSPRSGGGTISDILGTSGDHSRQENHNREGYGTASAILDIHTHIDSSESENLATLPEAVGSVNYGYDEDTSSDLRPKSV